jgi:hypothetical protein
LNVINFLLGVFPVVCVPLIDLFVALDWHLVVLFDDACDKLQEKFLLVLGQGLRVDAVHVDDDGDVLEDAFVRGEFVQFLVVVFHQDGFGFRGQFDCCYD